MVQTWRPPKYDLEKLIVVPPLKSTGKAPRYISLGYFLNKRSSESTLNCPIYLSKTHYTH